ncbi:NAD-dependent epimerase/dehydratase family protein [Spirilliplanes yamanashiensis]|uniref:NAD-dependent epimerase n=1 Tax=Spirilliplanes yamanashiensis TaxID=42233 RepID=A0A8J3YBI5_9ACTN|nr:NAD-dependent epimerase/dehydratase family protein [Spirilliplanes yamanashiensis]MDP9818043.1 nucleoside-diphosphate-sugar epimerase [Spirilliplanes yamanashiensis]GIJ04852.1 NAD-dependent epimerase [Spirilliplanes yamanashiensis]
MRIVIVGATGNAGTALLRRLRREPGLDLAGVVRRPPRQPTGPYDGVEWHAADIGAGDGALETAFAGADAVVHLGWQIQPSHDERRLHRTNVLGTRAVVDAVVRAGVPALVYASSVGTYAPGPKDEPGVGEDWPHTGVAGSLYSRHKAAVEALLDTAEAEHPRLRIVRMRPGLVFQRDAGAEIGRYFLGPFAPVRLLRFGRIPVVPDHPALRVQAVHADDLADAYARAALGDARGAFNIAAGPVLTPTLAARLFHGRTVGVPGAVLRAGAGLSWRLRLQPTDSGWVELGLRLPLMSTARAERELGWRPAVPADDALRELVAGLADRAHTGSAPLTGSATAPGRLGGVLLRGRLPGSGDPY